MRPQDREENRQFEPVTEDGERLLDCPLRCKRVVFVVAAAIASRHWLRLVPHWHTALALHT
jgi:hypothetical protein